MAIQKHLQNFIEYRYIGEEKTMAKIYQGTIKYNNGAVRHLNQKTDTSVFVMNHARKVITDSLG